MKKFFAFLLLAFLPFCFFGCSSDIIAEASKGANLYEIVAVLDDENKTITATLNLEYKNDSQSTLENLMFHLHPNAFSDGAKTNIAVSTAQEAKAYDNGKSYGGIDILSVKENNEIATFSIQGTDKHLLNVELKNSIAPNQSTKLEISFTLTLPNVNHRFGYGKHTINLGNWYPIVCMFENGEWHTDGYLPSGDPFYSEIANYDVTLTYDSDFILASTGELAKTSKSGSVTTSNYEAYAVRDFAMVLSKEFEVLTKQVGGTQVNYYYFDDENANKHLQVAVDALNTFNELIGQYPYKVLNVAKACFLHGGMEYPNLVYISDQVTNETEYNNAIIHEIAHQWWYGLVGNNELAYGWIDEGLAEYSTALFYDLNSGYDNTKTDVMGNALSSYLLFCDVYREVYDELNTSMNRNISAFKTETEYVYLTYVKGMLMFDNISETIGQNRMNKCLKALYENYRMKEVTPLELIETFEKASGRKLKNFITSWLDGTVILEEISG